MKATRPTLTDPVFVLPWRCDDRGCTEQWHKGTYWITLERFTLALGGTPPERKPERYTYDAYSDGDHEGVDPEDVPTLEAVEQAWREYHEDCAATGKDPLEEYIIPRYHERNVTWQVIFQVSVLGVVLQQVRRQGRGPWQPHGAASIALTRYLDVVSEGSRFLFNAYACEQPVATMDRLRRLAESDPDVTVHKTESMNRLKLTVKVTEKPPRKPSAVTRDIKRVARKAARNT